MAYQPKSKSYNKFIATAATATLVASAVAPMASADEVSTAAFTDVSDRYAEAIDYVVSENIAKGLEPTRYGIGESIKRVDAAIMIAKAAGLMNEKAPASGFSDVPDRAAIAVNSLKAAGVISGKADGSFGSQDNITRGQAAYMLAQAYELEAGNAADVDFSDVGASHRFAKEIAALVENGITDGINDTQFGTENSIKRGDFAIFLHRLYELEEVVETPEVASVSAINLEGFSVAFNTPVDENSFDAGDIKVDNVNVTAGNLEWAEDGKSVKISQALTHGTVYRVSVDGLETSNGSEVVKFEKLVDVQDLTAPSVAKTSYSYAAKTATVEFSEALANGFETGLRVYNKNGVDVTGSVSITPAVNEKSVTINVSALNPADNDTFKVVMVGATDVKGNVFANNRVEFNFSNVKADTVKPVANALVSKDQQTVRVTYSEAVDLANATLSFDGVTTAIDTTPADPAVLVVGDAVKADTTGKVWDVKVSTTNLSTTHNVGISGAVDSEANVQDGTFSKFVKFEADTTAPALLSTSTSGTKLILTFDENVDVNAGTITLVKPGNVRVVTSAITPTVDANNKKLVTIDLGANITDAGTYSVELALNMVEDAANNTKAYATSGSFTTNDTGKPSLLDANNDGVADAGAIVQSATNPSVFTVTYSEAVGNSALNLSNYLVNNQAVFSKAIFVGNTNTVELVAKPNTIDVDGATYLFTVGNVADLSGNVMTSETVRQAATENVLPVITSAKLLTTTTIDVDYSETVTGDSVTDFEVYVDGQKVALTGYNNANGVITLTNAVDPTKAISVKVVDTIEDTNGNAVVSGTTVNVTK